MPQKRWKRLKPTLGGINLKILLCEGKHDAWFFDEIMKEHIGGRIHTISDGRMDKLQNLLGGGCFNYIKTKYDLIIFGESGRPIITDKVLPGVIAATLGKVGDDVYIPFILDDDGVSGILSCSDQRL